MNQETMRDIILQEENEKRFNRKHIDAKIRAAIEASKPTQAKILQGIELVTAYLSGEYYASKMKRLAQLKDMDVPAMVNDILVGIAYYQQPELFTSASSQIAARLKFSDRAEAIATTAELMAVLCRTDAFDISKASEDDSLMLQSCIPLPDSLLAFIEESRFLPPMVCAPLELTHNFSSGYLTHNDSLLLGSGNHHDGDLCLDVLNTMGQVALKLDVDFLRTLEEEPTFALNTQRKVDGWRALKTQSYAMYTLLATQGNRFHFNHKVDKRGRIYSTGYHINPQGTAFKKAMLEFAEDELVEGVPL